MKSVSVYILTNDRQTVLYTGCTNDLAQRLYCHQHRLVPGFTKKYNVSRLVYFEDQEDIEAARRRERQIKGMTRAKKDFLIATKNPDWRDLSDDPGGPCGKARTGANVRDPSLRSG